MNCRWCQQPMTASDEVQHGFVCERCVEDIAEAMREHLAESDCSRGYCDWCDVPLYPGDGVLCDSCACLALREQAPAENGCPAR